MTQARNATVTGSGSTVTVRNAGRNGSLPAGGSTTFGFLGSTTGADSVPAQACSAT